MSAILTGLGIGIGKLAKGIGKRIKDRREGGLIDQGIDTGLGMGMHKWKQSQQLDQSQKLQEQQIQGQKEIGQFNQGLAIDTWKATASPEAQVANMKKAGLNPGLMYSGAGGGGGATTQGAQGVSGQQAYSGNDIGMALQMGMQNRLNQAQIDNINADTNLTNVRANKEGGIDTEIAIQGLKNLQKDEELKDAQKLLLELEADWKKIQNGYAERSNEENLKLLETANKKALEELDIVARNNKWDADTYKARIKKIEMENQLLGIQMEAQKAGIKLTQAQTAAVQKGIEKVNAEMYNWSIQRQQEWQKMSIQEKQAESQKMIAEAMKDQTEFNTGTGAELLRGSQIIGNVLSAISLGTKIGGK